MPPLPSTDVRPPRGTRPASRWRERTHGWIGIDLGTESIKIARIVRRRDGWTPALIRRMSVAEDIPLDVGALADGAIGGLIAAQLPPPMRVGGRQSACVLPMSIVDMQSMELPPATDRELRQMIAVELDARSVSRGGQREFDAFENPAAMGTDAELRTYTVFSLATDAAGGLADSLWTAGLPCERLETLPCVLARGVQLADPRGARGAVAALDWGATTPTLSIISQGRPVFTRLLRDCGLRRFIERGTEHFGCAKDEFRELLAACAAAVDGRDSLKAELSRLAEPLIEQLIRELHKTLAYLKQQSADHLPSRMWLFGGGALIPGIAARLSHLIGLEVRSWQLPGNSPQPWQAQFGAALALSSLGVQP